MRFTYTEVEDALKELDDGVFFVREIKESEEKEYEICIRYIMHSRDIFLCSKVIFPNN